MRFSYQVLLAVFIGAILAPIAMNIKWGELPRVFTAFRETYGPVEIAAPQMSLPENRDQMRIAIKELALAAGDAFLDDPCSQEARQAFRESVSRIGKQFIADMGCTSLFFCDLEKNAKGVYDRWYSDELDRKVSQQIVKVAEAGGISARDLGASRMLIGHPDEWDNVQRALTGPSPRPSNCPVMNSGS